MLRLKATYGCSDAAATRLADYSPTPNISQPHVLACIGTYLCGTAECSSVPALLGPPYPTCGTL